MNITFSQINWHQLLDSVVFYQSTSLPPSPQSGSLGQGQSTRKYVRWDGNSAPVGGTRVFCRQMLPLPTRRVEQAVGETILVL